jgi:hypothetical protein
MSHPISVENVCLKGTISEEEAELKDHAEDPDEKAEKQSHE